jgi:hypothetical protein
VVRACLFIYLVLVVCPLQYWPFVNLADNSWYFAINYAAAHHLVPGLDIVDESGPLGYLGVPQDIGNNLVKALGFQIIVWGIVVFVLWRILYRSFGSLRTMVFFTIFLGLSAKLYQYPNPLGIADLLVATAILLIVYHAGTTCGFWVSSVRYWRGELRLVSRDLR